MKQWCVHFYTNRKTHFKTKIKLIYRHHIYYLSRKLYFLLGLTFANGVGSDLAAEMCIAKEITQESLPDMSYSPTIELVSFWWAFWTRPSYPGGTGISLQNHSTAAVIKVSLCSLLPQWISAAFWKWQGNAWWYCIEVPKESMKMEERERREEIGKTLPTLPEMFKTVSW